MKYISFLFMICCAVFIFSRTTAAQLKEETEPATASALTATQIPIRRPRTETAH